MLFWILAVFFSWLLDLLAVLRLTDNDLELLILRHQIGILERNADRTAGAQHHRPRLSRLEKLSLAVLAHKLKEHSGATYRRLADSIFIFTPETA